MRVNFIQNVVFLRPPQNPNGDLEQRTHEQPPLSNDELVRGIVHLFVPVSDVINKRPLGISTVSVFNYA